MSERATVAIAGATGFVGRALRSRLIAEGYRVLGLTRSPTRAGIEDEEGVEWRHCDLFSMGEVRRALEGVDYAFYLVHSMHPSARLTQASFVDLDLLLADNFARAAEANRVRQILYLGGIRPTDSTCSDHLASRLEVEATLAGRAVPVTALRAGIVIGPGGSSLEMLVDLVRRLPAMVLPSWTRTRSAPIGLQDVLKASLHCLGNSETFGESYDIGGPEVMSYRDMMRRTAQVLGRKIPMFAVPFVTPGLSKGWVSLVTGTPLALVGPLVESLRHDVLPDDNPMQARLLPEAVPFETALKDAIDDRGRPHENPRRALRSGDDSRIKQGRTVRSVQRMPLPSGADAEWVADEYLRWLPRFVWPFLTVQVEGRVARFMIRATGLTLLELTRSPESSRPDRQQFLITGGKLARVDATLQGRFEFREVLERKSIIAAIHDFRPALPWYVYNASQALVHLVVMRAFGRHLQRVAPGRALAEG